MFGSNSTGWTALAIAAGVGVVGAYLFGQQLVPVIVAPQQPRQPVDVAQSGPSSTSEAPLEDDVFEPVPPQVRPVGLAVLLPQRAAALDDLAHALLDQPVVGADPDEQGVSELESMPPSPVASADGSEFLESADGNPAGLRPSVTAMLDLARNPSVTRLADALLDQPVVGADPDEQGVSELESMPPSPVASADGSEFLESADGNPAGLRPSVTAMLDLARNPSVTRLAELGRVASDLTLEDRSAEVDAAREAAEAALRQASTVGKVKLEL